jgi:hypothetical protein
MIVVERSREPGNAPAVFATGTAAASPEMDAAWPVSIAAACRAACSCTGSGNRRGSRWTTATWAVSGRPKSLAASYSARSAGAPDGIRPPTPSEAVSGGR